MTNRILNNMVEISRLAGSLQWQYERNLHLRKENRIRSIQSSLAIENNSLTVEQVTDLVNGKRVLGDPKEIREVQNAYEAYEEIMGYNPYAVRNFLKAHKLLTKGLVRLSGHFRSKDVGVFASDGLLLHMGARPELIPDLMKALFRWTKTDDTPLLVKSTVVHYEIEVIHPFEDGNGRMGRLWQSVLCMAAGRNHRLPQPARLLPRTCRSRPRQQLHRLYRIYAGHDFRNAANLPHRWNKR